MRLVKETKPVARKRHICSSCGSSIPEGQQYIRHTIADGACLETAKSHESCFEASQLIYGMGSMCEGELPPIDNFQEEDLLYIHNRQPSLLNQLLKDSNIAQQIWYGRVE